MLKRALEQPKLFAEFAGILLGDGSLSRYECKSRQGIKIQSRLKVTLDSREMDYSKYVQELLMKLFEVKSLVRFKKNENTADVLVFNKNLVIELENFGFVLSPKRHRAIIPKFFLNKKLKKYVLRGYFDTDGSLVVANNNGTIYPRLEMKIMPSPMQDQFISIVKEFGFRFGAYNIGNDEIRLQLNGRKELKKWMIHVGMSNKKHLEKLKKLNVQ